MFFYDVPAWDNERCPYCNERQCPKRIDNKQKGRGYNDCGCEQSLDIRWQWSVIMMDDSIATSDPGETRKNEINRDEQPVMTATISGQSTRS